MGGLAAAEPMLSEARRDLEAAGDRARLLRVVRTLGDQHEALGQLERAAERFREVAAIAHDLGDHGSEVRALLKIYSALMFLGRIDEAAAELAAAEARAADTSRLTRASVSWARGLTLYWSGRDPAGGERLIGEALGVFAESGSRSREESLLEHMAWVRRNEGDTRGAIALNERRLAILKEVGNTGRVPIVAAWLSMNHLELGDLDEAQRYAELACGMVLSHGTPAAATASVALGRVRDLQGRDEEAERLLKEAVAGWELTRMQTEAPYFYEALAAFHLRRGQRADGERMARRAEQIFVATFGAQTPALPSLRRRLALARQAGASGAGGEARTSG
jgi:tetratricopeptide (TPR) repeat protein